MCIRDRVRVALANSPRRILDMVERMVERGSAEYLVIGGRLVGRRPFRVTGSSEAWDKVYSRGELAKATLTISLEEYEMCIRDSYTISSFKRNRNSPE